MAMTRRSSRYHSASQSDLGLVIAGMGPALAVQREFQVKLRDSARAGLSIPRQLLASVCTLGKILGLLILVLAGPASAQQLSLTVKWTVTPTTVASPGVSTGGWSGTDTLAIANGSYGYTGNLSSIDFLTNTNNDVECTVTRTEAGSGTFATPTPPTPAAQFTFPVQVSMNWTNTFPPYCDSSVGQTTTESGAYSTAAVTVVATPTQGGVYSLSTDTVYPAQQPYGGAQTTVTVSGFLQPAGIVALSSSSLSFSPQPLNTTSHRQTIFLNNTTTSPVTIGNIVLSPADGFTETGFSYGAATNCKIGDQVAAGAACTLYIKYAPIQDPTAGAVTTSAKLSVTTSASSTRLTATFSGTNGCSANPFFSTTEYKQYSGPKFNPPSLEWVPQEAPQNSEASPIPQFFGYIPTPNPEPDPYVLLPTAKSGCALTSAATLLNSLNVSTNPTLLDQALKSSELYGEGTVCLDSTKPNVCSDALLYNDWGEFQWDRLASAFPLQIQWSASQDLKPGSPEPLAWDEDKFEEGEEGQVTLDQYLADYACGDSYAMPEIPSLRTYSPPAGVILQLKHSTSKGQHFVVVTGLNSNGIDSSGTDDWAVFDPGSSANSPTLGSLSANFTVVGTRTYQSTGGSSLSVSANSPVELLVMDPTGRELGDFNGADAFGIPYGSYTRDFQYNDDDSGGLANGDPSGLKGMSIPSPPTGTYQVVATGTGSGPYTLTFTGVATDGTEQSSVQTGTASLGATVVYNLTYSSTPGAPLGITTGGAAVVLSPGTLPAFPAQVVNTQSSAQTIKLSNPGTTPLAISSISVTGDFTETNTCESNLAADSSCAISVVFSPTGGGIRSGTLILADNAGGQHQTVLLSGMGTAPLVTPTVTVSPSASSITTVQALSVSAAVKGGTGNPTPTGSVILTSGGYTSQAATLNSGSATINVPAESLAAGADTLTVTYTPDTSSSATYNSAAGAASVTVAAPAPNTPSVTVTPSASSITAMQALSVSVAVNGGTGNPTPTGSLILTSGGYASQAATLSSGSATINVPAGSLAAGADTLTVTYTPDSSSSATYNTASGTASVTVVAPIQVENLGSFPTTPVGSTSSPQNLTVQLNSAQTVTSITAAVSQGGQQEYVVGTITGCTVDGVTTNSAGSTCTVPITFQPAYTGERNVSLGIVAGTGTLYLGLSGLATGPQIAFSPGIITPMAGWSLKAGYSGDGGPATSAELNSPFGSSVNSAGNVYIADTVNQRIRKVTASTGIIATIAGTGTPSYQGDGGPATSADLNVPTSVAVDAAGNVYIADSLNNVIREVAANTGIISTVVGNGTPGFSGDGGAANLAQLDVPSGLALDGMGNLYIADTGNNRVRKVVLTNGIISTVAGGGNGTGDGGPATSVALNGPVSVAADNAGNFYVADGAGVHEVAASTGTISTISNNYASNGSLSPTGLAVDSAGDLYIAVPPSTEFGSDGFVQEMVAATGTLTTIASGVYAVGPGATTLSPHGMALDSAGNLYITDEWNNSVFEFMRTNPPPQYFAATNVGSTSADSPHAIAIGNIGNAPLSLPTPGSGSNPAIPNNFVMDNSTTCPQVGAGSVPGTIASGSSCVYAVDFAPTAAGCLSGALTLTDNALNAGSPYATQSIALFGTGVGSSPFAGGQLNPASLPFAPQAFGTSSAAQTVTLTSCGQSPLIISSISVQGASFLNPLSYNCPVTGSLIGNALAPGSSCTINITFTATTSGMNTGTLTIQDNASNSPQIVTLSGLDVGFPLSVQPTSLSFGTQQINLPSAVQTVTVTNISQSTVTANWSVDYNFQADGGTCGSPATLAAGQSCTMGMRFYPVALGPLSGQLTLSVTESGLSNSGEVSLDLSGIGSTISASSLSFGPQGVGTTSASQSVTIIATTQAALNIASIAVNDDFAETNTCGSSVAKGSSCAITLTFTPTALGPRTGTLTITDSASDSPQTVTLTGTGTASPEATLSPTSLNFAPQNTGTTSAPQTVTISNPGVSALSITSIAASGDFAETNTCGASVAGGSSCAVSVTFAPTATGTRTGTLTITDNAGGSPQTVGLSGTGVAPAPAATVSPTSLTFDAQATGSTSAARTMTLTNSGTASLSIASISASGDFAEVNTCGNNVAAGANCTISVTFTPTSAGSRTGTLTITDNAGDSPQTVSLSGTGTSVTVSTPSTGLTVSSAGGSATATIQLTPADGFAGTVNLTCNVTYAGQGTATDPPTCSLNPSQATITGGTAASTTLTISTTAASSSARLGGDWRNAGGILAAFLFLGLIPRRRWKGLALFSILCIVLAGAIVGCGGGGSAGGGGTPPPANPGTTTGSYSVTVTATSGTVTASTTIPLSVQ